MQARSDTVPLIVVKDLDQAIEALEFSIEPLRRCMKDQKLWRWAVLSLHQAAQGFMVCALAGTDGTRALNHNKKEVSRYMKELWAYTQTGRVPKMPRAALDTFPNLYLKVQNKRRAKLNGKYKIVDEPRMMQQNVGSKAFKPPSGFDEHIENLNTYRNEFQHFTPAERWIVDCAVFLEPVSGALHLISFLALESGNILGLRNSEEKTAQVRSLLNKAQRVLRGLACQYGVKVTSY